MAHQPPVVIDNGTGYTKMGFACNNDPQFIIPTAIASRGPGGKRGELYYTLQSVYDSTNTLKGVEDLDFYIGDEAFANQKTYNLSYPVRHGQVENWDLMERFWEQSIFKYMKCEPEDHYFLLVTLSLLLWSLHNFQVALPLEWQHSFLLATYTAISKGGRERDLLLLDGAASQRPRKS